MPVLRFVATALLVLLLTCCAQARTWTNDKGETIEAVFLRVSGRVALLNSGGEIIRAPLARLSAADREWIEAYEAVSRTRDWATVGGEEVRGRYLRYEAGGVVLRTRDGEHSIPLQELQPADRKLLALATDSEVPGLPAGERVWTDVSGKTISAEYRGVEGDRVVLFMNNREYRVPLSQLSAGDRQFISQQNQPPISPPESDGAPEEAAAAASPDDVSPAPDPSPVDSMPAEFRAQYEAAMEQQREAQRRHEAWEQEEQRRQEEFEREMAEEEEQWRRQQEEQQEQIKNRTVSSPPSPPPSARPTPGVNRGAPPARSPNSSQKPMSNTQRATELGARVFWCAFLLLIGVRLLRKAFSSGKRS